jgi:hypothetical protein
MKRIAVESADLGRCGSRYRSFTVTARKAFGVVRRLSFQSGGPQGHGDSLAGAARYNAAEALA